MTWWLCLLACYLSWHMGKHWERLRGRQWQLNRRLQHMDLGRKAVRARRKPWAN